MLSRVPCALKWVLAVCLFYVRQCAKTVLGSAVTWEVSCGRRQHVAQICLGWCFPKEERVVWSQKDAETWAGVLAILQECSVISALSCRHVLLLGTGD